MKTNLLLLLSALFFSCHNQSAKQENKSNQLIGTWELISATTITGDGSHADDLTGKRMIKIINESHFAFLNHDLRSMEKDSLDFFVAGGGSYQLTGSQYTELLEYCNFREWEGNKFEFNVEIRGDTLIQSGIEKLEKLGVDRKIIETYLKVKN